MRRLAAVLWLVFAFGASAAELESRVLTHYVPQDLLETAVRTEGWTEVPLKVAGGPRKGDVVRVWCGGSIDRGNGDRVGENVNGPDGLSGVSAEAAKKLALSQTAEHAFALLVKTEGNEPRKCAAPGKPLEVKLTKDNEKLWVGFNDERGRYNDNHLGKGRRHELDPLWLRVEVVRIIVD
jgi:hypothetical protein